MVTIHEKVILASEKKFGKRFSGSWDWIRFSLLLTQRLTVKLFDLVCCEWPWSFSPVSNFYFHRPQGQHTYIGFKAWLEHFVWVWSHQNRVCLRTERACKQTNKQTCYLCTLLHLLVTCSDAWIITGGTDGGVMKYTGDAVRKHRETTGDEVTTMGIATWGVLKKSHQEKLKYDDKKVSVPLHRSENNLHNHCKSKIRMMLLVLIKSKSRESCISSNL